MPHSHTDLGWLYTVDEYFSDNKRTGWFRGSVQVMLNSVMGQLKLDQSRTFTYAEMKYFKQWFDSLSEADK